MATKSKTFDCVEMKRRIQSEISDEYKAANAKGMPFLEFLKKSQSGWISKMKEKYAKSRKGE